MGPNRGPVAWNVRAIWEEYSGWFRHESPTELYAVPVRQIYTDLVDLTGVKPLLDRATAYLDAGEPERALHLIEIALSAEPSHRLATAARVRALEQLIERTGGETFDDLAYLETELFAAQASLVER
jgi:alkyl sulfatase BDS1-like metallo-beta-lactamase superfamily hydrolase